MKTISLPEAHKVLLACSAVLIDGILVLAQLADLNGEDENEFLALFWNDGRGLRYEAKFAEGVNRTIVLAGNQMVLVDDNGDDMNLTLFAPGPAKPSPPP